MKLDNYILDTSEKIVICYFSAISFISLNCENTGPFKKKSPQLGKLRVFFSANGNWVEMCLIK